MSEIILHLSAGQGPAECEWVVGRLVRVWAREAAAAGLVCEPVEPVGDAAASVLLRVAGDGAEAFVAARCGTIRWIGASTLRPLHRRRNWFVAATRAPADGDVPALRDADIRYQTLRASGPGGQHVNKTDSAVRATHSPTGLTAFSQEQRSQFANRRIARLKLALLFDALRDDRDASDQRTLWTRNRELERGNAVRTYRGDRFVFDHSTI
ncbi:peptide chain release factor H [Sphingomonas sp. Leaf4]|uniref:peptide chain release factor H n=1 Tax=Sphingomonas sp. Leaf4 TaxID=2876553 RepID=UPI001E4CC2B3|nr:peptide chain release factor H [Sphingomonas sp. Leaf4]